MKIIGSSQLKTGLSSNKEHNVWVIASSCWPNVLESPVFLSTSDTLSSSLLVLLRCRCFRLVRLSRSRSFWSLCLFRRSCRLSSLCRRLCLWLLLRSSRFRLFRLDPLLNPLPVPVVSSSSTMCSVNKWLFSSVLPKVRPIPESFICLGHLFGSCHFRVDFTGPS